MHDVEQRHGYVLDPHSAVGVLGWECYAKQNHPQALGIVLATAHPAKFAETVARATGVRPEMPERLAALLDRPKKSIPFPNRYSELQEFLLSANS
jgi:threonine synthase